MGDSRIPETDEKSRDDAIITKASHPRYEAHFDPLSTAEAGDITAYIQPESQMQRWVNKIESLAGIESGGIERVPDSIKTETTTTGDYVRMCLVWLSANLTANNMMIGMLGPLNFGLGLRDSMFLATFGSLMGGAGSSYIASFGPASGNCTLVIARYMMGWIPSRLCVALNFVIMLGYGIIDILAAGVIMSAVNGKGMSVIVGVIVAAAISLVVCVVGIRLFHIYERWAWLPQAMVILILIGVSGPSWDSKSVSSNSGAANSANQASFFFLCLASPPSWSPAAADFFVYFPTNSKRWKVALATTLGLGGSCMISYCIGIGVASGVSGKEFRAMAADKGLGILLVEAYRPLGAFGDLCSIIIALGVISNNIPGTYSATLSFQLLCHWMQKLPRFLWTIIVVIIYSVCACVGRNELYGIIQNFVVIMGYWTAAWMTISVEEELIFRRRDGGYDWTIWNDPRKLPVGIAASTAFAAGWAGAVLGMWQTWFTGPIAKLVASGIDIGIPLSMSCAALVYPPLRYAEFKYFGC
ncbi:hypothetical protein N7523_010191 [Penicillium sp. IBT 18751x]|nr:hypothetical protein N7523_010191 [Penicillium sp. IBT 18751x]